MVPKSIVKGKGFLMKQIRKRIMALLLLLALSGTTLMQPVSSLPYVQAAGNAASSQTAANPSDTSMTVKEGEKVTVSVASAGQGSSYQWYYKKADASVWSLWKGHTTAKTSANSNATWHGMQLYCKITTAAGAVSSSAPITILIEGASTAITQQPQDILTKSGKSVSFSIKAVGAGLTYQWYYKKADASVWSLWKGHTTAATKAVSNESWDGMQVRCTVRDSAGNTLTSKVAKITIGFSPYFVIEPPETLSVLNGGRVTVMVDARGTGLKYQWYYKKVGAAGWSKWPGHTESVAQSIANATWDGMLVRCEVTGVMGDKIVSSPCKFTVDGDETLHFLSQSGNVTAKAGDRVTFSVETLGPNVKYQWYFRKVGMTDWQLWKGHTTAKTSAIANESWDGMQVYCLMWQTEGYKPTSNPVTVTIQSPAHKVATVGVNAKTHTQSEIKNYIKGLNINTTSTVTYAVEPVTWPGPNCDMYNPGKLSSESLNNALNILNSIRYIAGIPNNVKLDSTFTEQCQAGALVNYANDELSHYPDQPRGMKSDIYKLGKKGCSNSNIAWTGWKAGFHYMLVNQWLDDSDDYNLYDLGHRRWLLNPAMGKTGFGLVKGGNGAYGQMYATDTSGSSDVTTVVWPAQQTPLNYFPADSAWSITSTNLVAYDDIRVKLERIRDGEVKTYQMSIGGGSSDDGFIKYNSQRYGAGECIIFRPNERDYKAGDIYNVYLYENNKLTKTYSVTFFNLD